MMEEAFTGAFDDHMPHLMYSQQIIIFMSTVLQHADTLCSARVVFKWTDDGQGLGGTNRDQDSIDQSDLIV